MLADDIRQKMRDGLVPLEEQYRLVVTSELADRLSASVVAQNEVSFVECFWHPRDGLTLSIGPLEQGRIPNARYDYGPGDSLREYEVAWFVKLANGKPLETKASTLSEACQVLSEKVGAVQRYASDFLLGDWSRRSELDRLIEENWRKTSY